ncbi:hypothetical protein JMG10_35385 [Nostoc ellipsosporum NOK]|nr:hypothetical protein [Nostoc ellipsosporum NOK]
MNGRSNEASALALSPIFWSPDQVKPIAAARGSGLSASLTRATLRSASSQAPPPFFFTPFQPSSRNSARPVGSAAKPLTTRPWVCALSGAARCQLGARPPSLTGR